MALTLSVLCDNNTLIDRYYYGEPAVSYYIEIDGARILFDTGYSDVFLKNSVLMDIDLSAITHLVISHGHDDHTRGLPFLSERHTFTQVPLICHPHCFAPRWAGELYVGPPMPEEMPTHFDYQPSCTPVWLTENCVFLGEIPTTHAFEPRHKMGTVRLNGQLQDDYMLDDSALCCRTDHGLFIITGCSHSGICNIISHAQQVCGDTRIAGVIGGFHLLEMNDRVRHTIDYLAALGTNCRRIPCHCVSLHVKAAMLQAFDFEEIGSGTVIHM